MKNGKNGTIYKITNVHNNKIYVGQTTRTLEQRLKSHFSSTKNPNNKTYFANALRKYGFDNFKIEIIETDIPKNKLNKREIFWIDKLQSLNPLGYNGTKGGGGGDMSNSENFKQSMKIRNYKGEGNPNFGKYKENSPNFGKKRTELQRITLKNSLQMSWDNLERKKKQSERIKGENNPMFGKSPANARRILIDTIEYLSAADAVRKSGLSINYINKHKKYI